MKNHNSLHSSPKTPFSEMWNYTSSHGGSYPKKIYQMIILVALVLIAIIYYLWEIGNPDFKLTGRYFAYIATLGKASLRKGH